VALIQQHRFQLRINTDFAPYGLDEPYRVFISEDPIGFGGGSVNLYTYVRNNVLNWIDPWGLKPGDPYPTQDEAGINAIKDINPISISQDTEYGGWVYQNHDSTYSYTAPNPGTGTSTTLGPKPSTGTVTGDYHTHGTYRAGYDNENFSPQDKTGYSGSYNTGYLGTPSGAIKKYNATTGQASILIFGHTCPKQVC
jgi:uncharacterized protein RhaS with RHS repeats